MAAKASNTTLGVFVVAAVALATLAIVLLGKGTWFRRSFTLAFEFEGDVSGLVVGAPVTIKGFKIGSVRDLRLDYDLDSGSFRTTALAEMTPDMVLSGDKQRLAALQDDGDLERERERLLREMVAGGARAQLNLQSFVTGLLRIDIDFPENSVPAELEGTPEGYWKIPTQSSSMEVLQRTLTGLPLSEMVHEGIATLKSIRKLADSEDLRRGIAGIDELVVELHSSVAQLDKRLASIEGEFHTLSASAQEVLQASAQAVARFESESSATLDDARRLVGNIDAQVEPTTERLAALLATAESAFGESGRLLAALNGLTPGDSALAHQLGLALGSLTGALDSLRVLTSYLEQHPEALLRGKD